MNKMIFFFGILIVFTLNFALVSGETNVTDESSNFTNSDKLEHVDILHIQKELLNVTEENSMHSGNARSMPSICTYNSVTPV